MDISKLKEPLVEEETPDMKMIEDNDSFTMSVEKCEKIDEAVKVNVPYIDI